MIATLRMGLLSEGTQHYGQPGHGFLDSSDRQKDITTYFLPPSPVTYLLF